METQSVLTNAGTRFRLRLDPQLGAGNFLHYAHSTSGRKQADQVHVDRACSILDQPVTRLSLDELKRTADSYAAYYLNQGIEPLDPVAVYCTDGLQYLVHYAALTGIGAIPALTNGAMAPDVAASYLQRIGVVGVVSDVPRLDALRNQLNPADLRLLVDINAIPGGDPSGLPHWYPYRHLFDSPVMITHSSGTTGVPKAVLLQHGKWFHGIRHLLGLDPAEGAGRYLSALPTSHNASVAYAMHAVLTGAELMLSCDHDGAAVARAIEQFRPATVVSFPDTWVALAETDLTSFDLSSVNTWINSGDAAHETHIRRLLAHGHHHRGGARVAGSQFIDGLGSSELGHSSFRIVHTSYTDTYDRCVGIPQEWVDAAILDENGRVAPDGVIGRLGVRSPSVTSGYWNDSRLTLKSQLRGYWLTGDVCYRDHMGCFYHLDRISDVIHTAQGPLYSLQTEELILKHQQCLADCVVFGVRSDLSGFETATVFALPRARCHCDELQLLEAINTVQADKRRPALAVIRIADRAEIPVGITGKVLKQRLRDRFADSTSLAITG
jgi:acyl-CoA synthetase (AMP-forming)/AMP-acid ligase II